MTFKTRCPNCNCKLEMDDEWVGQECQCPQCQKNFVISAPAPTAPPMPKPKPVPMIAHASGISASAPSPPLRGALPGALPPPPKVSFRPAPGANRYSAAQQEPPNGKTIICPKCKNSYTVNQPGVYPCRCGTTLELLDNGSINIQMVIPKHGVGFYILIGVLSFLMLCTIVGVLMVLTAEG